MNDKQKQPLRSVKDVREQAKSYFSDWIRIVDDINHHTIKEYTYKDGVPDKVDEHCWKCITVNHCWFVDEVDKKPKVFDYTKYISGKIPISDTKGLYHPNCHCKEIPIRNPQPLEIKLIETQGKIGYMWKSKLHLYHLWGYADDERDAFEEMLAQKTKESYVSGNYEYQGHTKCGL